jgi:AraC family transcriptional activator of pobA
MKTIPVHKIRDRVENGFEIHYTGTEELRRAGDKLGVHRDDHYIFFMIESGSAEINVDFCDIILPGQSVYYLLPGQVHHRINTRDAKGWFMAVDTGLIAKEFREIFEDHLLMQKPYQLTDERYLQCYKLLHLLNDTHKSNSNEPFYLQNVYALLNSFLATVAASYSKLCTAEKGQSRPKQIAQDFKRLLSENFITEKSPTAYAQMLNISGAYLNESLNKITGMPVSYWITHEVMLEAKRLLYYTQLTVKEIAHQLGYDDHTYFSRLFKSTVNKTPLEFRDSYHK